MKEHCEDDAAQTNANLSQAPESGSDYSLHVKFMRKRSGESEPTYTSQHVHPLDVVIIETDQVL